MIDMPLNKEKKDVELFLFHFFFYCVIYTIYNFISSIVNVFTFYLFIFQECVPEKLELKIKVFKELDELCTDDMILASSSSCIGSSKFNSGLKHAKNILVVHPVSELFYFKTSYSFYSKYNLQS